MKGISLSIILFSLLAGILSARLIDLPEWTAALPATVAMLCMAIGIMIRKKYPFKLTPKLNETVSGFIFFGIGIFGTALSRPSVADFNSEEMTFEGVVEDYNVISSGDKLIVALERLIDDNGKSIACRNIKALITLQAATSVSYGDYIIGKAQFKPIKSPSNFINKDYIEYLESHNIYLQGFTGLSNFNIKKNSSLSVYKFKELRDRCEIVIENTGLDKATKNFLISVVLGDKSSMTYDQKNTFADAGVAHIFAVSGFHVTIVSLFVLGLLALIFHGKLRKWKYMACLPILWVFILLTGATPATCRAGIMLTLSLTALFLQRKSDSLLFLCWAAVLILCFSPGALFDVGFQLSFISVGGLLLIARPLNFIDRRSHPIIYKVVSITLATLTASFSTWLVCAFYFHKFSLAFLPLNLLAVPLLPFYLFLAIGYIFLFYLGIRLKIVAAILDQGFSLFQKGAENLTSLSGPIENFHPGTASVLLWIFALLALGFVLQNPKPRKRLWIPVAAFALTLFTLPLLSEKQPRGFIIQKNHRELTIVTYAEGRDKLISIPSDGVRSTEINGKQLLFLNSDGINHDIRKEIGKADYILLSGNCKVIPTDVVEYKKRGAVILTHPTLHWRREKNILAYASERKIPVHSLRYDGPLHVFD